MAKAFSTAIHWMMLNARADEAADEPSEEPIPTVHGYGDLVKRAPCGAMRAPALEAAVAPPEPDDVAGGGSDPPSRHRRSTTGAYPMQLLSCSRGDCLRRCRPSTVCPDVVLTASPGLARAVAASPSAMCFDGGRHAEDETHDRRCARPMHAKHPGFIESRACAHPGLEDRLRRMPAAEAAIDKQPRAGADRPSASTSRAMLAGHAQCRQTRANMSSDAR